MGNQTSVHQTWPKSLLETPLEISRLFKLLTNPGTPHTLLVVFEFVVFNALVALEVLVDAFSSEHACLHSVVGALNLGHVEETSAAAGQHTSWEG